MKNTLLLLLGLFSLLITSCEPSSKSDPNFTGYVVRKEYKPEGRCHDGRETQFEAGIALYSHHSHHHIHHIHHRPHRHRHQSATYKIYVANHQEIVSKYLSSKSEYDGYKCGQKVTIKR